MSIKRHTRKPTRTNLSVLAQVCNLIPAFLTQKLAREFGVDKKAGIVPVRGTPYLTPLSLRSRAGLLGRQVSPEPSGVKYGVLVHRHADERRLLLVRWLGRPVARHRQERRSLRLQSVVARSLGGSSPPKPPRPGAPGGAGIEKKRHNAMR